MKILSILTLLTLSGCVFNVRVVNNERIPDEKLLGSLQKLHNKDAVIHVAGYKIPVKIMGSDDQRVVISDFETVREIPLLAISKIEPLDGSIDFSSLAGYTLAGTTGGFLGYLAAQKTPDGGKKDEAKIAAASAGAVLGMLIIHGFSYNDDNLAVNKNLRLFEMIPGSSSPIKATAIHQNGLFQDLNLNAGETLTQMRIYQYDQSKYIMMYEVHNGQALVLRWKIVEDGYIQTEKKKINSSMRDQIFKSSSLKSE